MKYAANAHPSDISLNAGAVPSSHWIPSEWWNACLPKLNEVIDLAADRNPAGSELLVAAVNEVLWRQKTDIPPEAAQFTIIVPVHDEQNNLSNFFVPLEFGGLPRNTQIAIIFVTNACRDCSQEVISGLLTHFGPPVIMSLLPLPDEVADPKIEVYTAGNLRFMHVRTATAGKANALTLGNAVARALGHRIAISIDANNWIEPGAVAELFQDAHKAFGEFQEGRPRTVLLTTQPVTIKSNQGGRLNQRLAERDSWDDLKSKGKVSGWMMAWDTKWVENLGGIPPTAIEDFSLAVCARKNGFQVGYSNATIWGRISNSPWARFREGVRLARGIEQLLAQHGKDPAVKAMIEQAFPWTESFSRRLGMLFRSIRENPHDALWLAARFAAIQLVRLAAYLQYRRNPTWQSWTAIKETK